MRAAEDLLFYDQGLNPLRVEDTEYLLADLMVCSKIAIVTVQSRHFGLGALGPNDSDRYLGGSRIVRAVEHHRGHRKTAANFLVKR